MSDKRKWPRSKALEVANEIVERLRPCCERLAIAGSLRRRKAEVGDVEILFVPKMTLRPIDMFDSRIVSVADEVIEDLLENKYFTKRPSKIGVFTWGEANKLAIHSSSGIPVDLFSTSIARWWVSLVIRTGSKDTNLLLTTGAQRRGGRLNAYGTGVTWSDGTKEDAHSEEDVFKLCGVPYREPQYR